MMQPFLRILCMLWLSAATDDCQECQGSASPSKAGVAMLVRTKKAEIASAVASMEDGKTDGIEREAALIKKVLTNPTAELTESMVNQLASMRITPEVEIFLDATLKELIPVFQDLEEATHNDTAERDRFLTKFDEIQELLDGKKVERKVGGTVIKKYRTSHTTCRDEEQKKYEILTECRKEEDQLLEELKAAKAILESKTDDLKGLICDDDDVTNNLESKINSAGPFADAGNAYITADEKYKAKVAECKIKESELKKQKQDCDNKQKAFETQVCTYGGKFDTWCKEYATAHDTETEIFKTVWEGILSRMHKRLFEWKHLKRVHCTLSAIKNLGHDWTKDQIMDTINNCNTKPFHNPVLVIEEKPIPDKVPCPYTQGLTLPCSEDFTKKEYSALPANAPAAECFYDCSGILL